MLEYCLLSALFFITGLGQGQDGEEIAYDPKMFSERFRSEFEEMTERFAEFGFELDVLENEQPSLVAITDAYGQPDAEEEVDVIIGFRDREETETLVFYYFHQIGFGVRPSDPEQLVIVVKRR